MHLRRPLLLMLLPALTLANGCALFGLDDREFEINLPEIPIGPVQFRGSLIAADLCPPTDEERYDMLDPITEDIVQGFKQNLAEDQNEVDLEQYQTDQITGVTVRTINYSIALNTLQKDLEPIEIYFGPADAIPDSAETVLTIEDVRASGAVMFGDTDPILAGTTTGGRPKPVRRDPAGAEKVRDHLSDFSFSSVFRTSITLEPEDCANLGGELEVAVGIAITFFVTPF